MPCFIKSRTSFIGIWNIWTPRCVWKVYCKKVLKSKEFLWFSPSFIITSHNKWMLLSYCEEFAILSLNVPVFQHWLKRWLVQTRCIFCRWLNSSAVDHFHLCQKINVSAATQRFNGTYETSSLPLPSASLHYSFQPVRESCSPPPPRPFSHVSICSDHRKVKWEDAFSTASFASSEKSC